MCGIAGVATVDPNRPGMTDAAVRMTACAVHRGPDDLGTFTADGVALGHRRLAIIDPTPAGHQPTTTPDGRFTLTYNGEIYNYRELRAELAASWEFRTSCDTEVLLAAWARWGTGCLDRLRGMFAFAVWDAEERALFLVRDRFAIKPLFYAQTPDALYFASEVRQIRAAGVELEPNDGMVFDFIESGLVEGSGPDTFFQNVSQVPAGSVLRWQGGTGRTTVYYEPRARAGDGVSLEEALREAVGLHLRSDVPVGSCLSGGLDSSVVVALVHANRSSTSDDQFTVTAGVDDPTIDERPYARQVAERLDVHGIEVVPTLADLLNDLPRLVQTQEQPFTDLGVYLQWRVMKAASEHGLKVMLDGQGADEILCGYSRHRVAFAKDLRRRRRIRELGHLLTRDAPGSRASLRNALAVMVPSTVERLGLAAYRGESVRRIAGPRLNGTRGAHPRSSPVHGSFLEHSRMDDIRSRSLPSLLRYEDRNSMAFGVEARVPYVDHVVVEHALAISGDALFADGASKAPLRAIATKLVPGDVATRRDKLGFSSLQPEWFRSGLGSLAEQVLSDPGVRDRGLIDAGVALEQLRRARAGGTTSKVWRALSVALWDSLVVRQPASTAA